MKYILLTILILSFTGCSICWLLPNCDEDISEAMATRYRAENKTRVEDGQGMLFWPMLDMWIITEPQRN